MASVAHDASPRRVDPDHGNNYSRKPDVDSTWGRTWMAAVRAAAISDRAFRLAHVLADHVDPETHVVVISRANLASDTRKSDRTVDAGNRELVGVGLLTVEPTWDAAGDRGPNRYRLHLPAEQHGGVAQRSSPPPEETFAALYVQKYVQRKKNRKPKTEGRPAPVRLARALLRLAGEADRQHPVATEVELVAIVTAQATKTLSEGAGDPAAAVAYVRQRPLPLIGVMARGREELLEAYGAEWAERYGRQADFPTARDRQLAGQLVAHLDLDALLGALRQAFFRGGDRYFETVGHPFAIFATQAVRLVAMNERRIARMTGRPRASTAEQVEDPERPPAAPRDVAWWATHHEEQKAIEARRRAADAEAAAFAAARPPAARPWSVDPPPGFFNTCKERIRGAKARCCDPPLQGRQARGECEDAGGLRGP
jgi:hypothetical protein